MNSAVFLKSDYRRSQYQSLVSRVPQLQSNSKIVIRNQLPLKPINDIHVESSKISKHRPLIGTANFEMGVKSASEIISTTLEIHKTRSILNFFEILSSRPLTGITILRLRQNKYESQILLL